MKPGLVLMRLSPVRFSLRLSRPGLAVLMAIMGLMATGCGKRESISQYSVAKENSGATETTPAAPALSSSRNETSTNPTAWFFKLEGPPEIVSEVEPQFAEVVESVRFEDGEPTWSLPEGWSQTPGSRMRFATLTVESSDPPLEVSVIPLPVFGDDVDEYLRQNIDRWRRQVGLDPMPAADWKAAAMAAGEVRESSTGEAPVTFVSLTGKSEKFDPAQTLGAVLIPDASQAGPSALPVSPPAASAGSEPSLNSPLTFDTPAGWEPGKASAMRAASFAVTDGDKQVDISAMTAGGDELANVNRWRGQVGLDSISQEELDESAREVQVDGATGRIYEIVGETETILAAIVPGGGRTWFFKLMGDPALAAREKANFESFVTSVKLP